MRWAGAVAFAVGMLLGGCSAAEVTPSAAVTTLMPGAERWFKLSWETTPERDGSVRLRGYLVNTYGEAAGKVQLLAQALDANGNVVAQRIEWVPDVVPGFGRAYFEVPKMPKADAYRVTVWSYERIEGGDRLFPR